MVENLPGILWITADFYILKNVPDVTEICVELQHESFETKCYPESVTERTFVGHGGDFHCVSITNQ